MRDTNYNLEEILKNQFGFDFNPDRLEAASNLIRSINKDSLNMDSEDGIHIILASYDRDIRGILLFGPDDFPEQVLGSDELVCLEYYVKSIPSFPFRTSFPSETFESGVVSGLHFLIDVFKNPNYQVDTSDIVRVPPPRSEAMSYLADLFGFRKLTTTDIMDLLLECHTVPNKVKIAITEFIFDYFPYKNGLLVLDTYSFSIVRVPRIEERFRGIDEFQPGVTKADMLCKTNTITLAIKIDSNGLYTVYDSGFANPLAQFVHNLMSEHDFIVKVDEIRANTDTSRHSDNS